MKAEVCMQGFCLGEILRDLLICLPKISLKSAKWEEKSHSRLKNFAIFPH